MKMFTYHSKKERINQISIASINPRHLEISLSVASSFFFFLSSFFTHRNPSLLYAFAASLMILYSFIFYSILSSLIPFRYIFISILSSSFFSTISDSPVFFLQYFSFFSCVVIVVVVKVCESIVSF